MELIHIVPVRNREFYLSYSKHSKNDTPGSVMCLTHLVEESSDYRDFFKEYKGYKILDNSLIELKNAVSIQRVISAAEAIEAQEIILPDVFQDRHGTRDAVEAALAYMSNNGLLDVYNVMAVCQGQNIAAFDACFRDLEEIHEINVIGIPKVCAKMHPAGRPYFEHLWKYSARQIHLLGLWYGWEELTRFDRSRIRSVDSCQMSFQSAYNLPHGAVRPDGFTLDLKCTCLDTFDLTKRAIDLRDRINK